mmetsp:Transcript_21996/g.32691  ORF Transcript_21996/g.32691 Transcript_21996/m.32691 type:complete len:1192 (-) Transcript_21996:26-3601(-)
MWKSLMSRTSTWVNVPFAGNHLVEEWSNTVLALSERSLAILYGASGGTDSVIMGRGSKRQNLKLEDDYVFYAWHRMLHVIGSINSIQHPNIFLTAVTGVNHVVGKYIGVQAVKNLLPPNGNTILHIFGEWLFEAVQRNRPSFEEGTALALKILSCIFIERVRTTIFLPIYLARFYHCLQSVLLKDGRVLMSALLNTTNLFSRQFEGSQVLYPFYLYAISRIFSKKINNFTPHQPQTIHQACLQTLSTIVCVPNQFPDVAIEYPSGLKLPSSGSGIAASSSAGSDLAVREQLSQSVPSLVNEKTDETDDRGDEKSDDDTDHHHKRKGSNKISRSGISASSSNSLIVPNHNAASIFSAVKFVQLREFVAEALMNALRHQTYPQNIKKILHLVFLYAYENIDNDKDFATQALSQIVRTLANSGGSHRSWPPDVTRVALKTIAKMTLLYKFLGDAGKPQARWIVSQLSKYIIWRCQPANSGKLSKEDEQNAIMLVAESFRTISDWIMVDQWIFEWPDVVQALMDAVVIGIDPKGEKQKTDKPEQSSSHKKDDKNKKRSDQEANVNRVLHSSHISSAARYTLCCLLRRLGNFPTPQVGASSISTMINEQEVLAHIVKTGSERGASISDPKQYVQFFLLHGDTIITLIDRPYGISERSGGKSLVQKNTDNKGPHLTIIVRDQTGKYAWDLSYANLPISERLKPSVTLQHCAERPKLCSSPFEPSTSTVDSEHLSEVFEYLKRRYKGNSIISHAKSQCESESEALKKVGYGLTMQTVLDPPTPANPFNSSARKHRGRMLLASLGLFDLNGWNTIQLLEPVPHFWNKLKLLDACRERITQSVAVFYHSALSKTIAAGMRPGSKIMQRTSTQDDEFYTGSQDYQDFVASLGWGVSTTTHPGHLGGIESPPAPATSSDANDSTGADESRGRVAPYYASHSHEVIFHVSTLLPPSKTSEHLMHSDGVQILWMESDIEEYQPALSKSSYARILIQPLQSGLFKCRVVTLGSSDDAPLLDGSVVSKRVLGPLVRETAMVLGEIPPSSSSSSSKKSKKLRATIAPTTTFEQRADIIADLVSLCRPTSTLSQFYAYAFSAAPRSAVLPSLVSPRFARLSSFSRGDTKGSSSRASQRSTIKLGSRPHASDDSSSKHSSSKSHRSSSKKHHRSKSKKTTDDTDTDDSSSNKRSRAPSRPAPPPPTTTD